MSNFSTALSFLKSGTPVRRRAWNNHCMRLVGDELKFIADKGKDNGHARLTTEDMLANDWYVHTESGAAPLPRISDVRLSELLFYATKCDQVDDNTRDILLVLNELQQRRAAD